MVNSLCRCWCSCVMLSHSFNLIWLYDRLDLLAELYGKVEALGLEPPLVGRVYGFGQMPEALEYLQSGRSVGKVVVSLQKEQHQEQS